MNPLGTDSSAGELELHSTWMRRLARALVDDTAAADDVVQEAWLKLGRRRGSSGPGYLALVVRSLAWSRRRGERRRALREAASARPEALPSIAEVESRVEIARLVAEALESLAEPYRTTLVLRYFDDLSAAEIARRRGVPAATVRSQHKRGLELLREQLDRRPGGRDTWLPALLPFARSEAAAGGALIASLSGLIAMKIALAGLCALLCVALAWRLVARGGNSATESLAIAPAAATSEAHRSRLEAAHVEASTRAPASASLHAPATTTTAATTARDAFVLHARAVDDRDLPLAGAWLEIGLLPGRSATAEGDGRIAHALPSATIEREAQLTSNRTLEVRLGAPGRRTRNLRPALAAGAAELDLGDVRLEPGASLAGRVVDEGSIGVEGALVVFHLPVEAPADDASSARAGPQLAPPIPRTGDEPVRAWSGPGGTFRLDGLPAGHGSLWARGALGLWSWTPPIGLRPGEERNGFEIVVSEAAERVITGRIVDPEGSPTPGVQLTFHESLEPEMGWWNACTDELGRFHFVLREGRTQILRAQAPDWEWDDLERAGIAPGTHDLELAFERSDWLVVEVRAADGRLLTDGHVRGLPAEGPTDDALPRCESALDAQGRARLRRPDVALRVRVEAPSYRSLLLGPFEPDAFPEPLVATLEPLPALAGQVLLPDGLPAAGARVSLHRGAADDEVAGDASRLTHQGWGGDGEAFVHLLHVEPSVIVTADAEGRYRLPLPGVDPVASGEVAPRSVGLAALGYATDASRELAQVDTGQSWYVHAALKGHATLTSGPHLLAAHEDSELELRLPRGGALAGRLLVEGGSSPAGWTMVATDALAEITEAPVARDGSYRFDDLHPGEWQLCAYEPGRRHQRGARLRTERVPDVDVQVAEGRTTEHDHRTQPRAAARLDVRLAIDGAAPGCWSVRVATQNPQRAFTQHEGTLDPDGRFSVRLEPGLETSLLLFGKFAGTQVWIEGRPNLRAGDNEWSFELTSARIEGHVAPLGPSPGRFSSTHYQVEVGDVRIRSALQVDEQGRFGPVRVAAGRGILRGPQDDPREPGPIWAELELAPGETRALDLR